MTTLLLLGEAPGSHVGHNPDRHALFPYPPNCAGRRLMDLMGMHMGEYIRLSRRNLVPHYQGKTTPATVARHEAQKLLEGGVLDGRAVLVVGSVPARGLLLQDAAQFHWYQTPRFQFALIPHTSGRSRTWNDPSVRAAGVAFLRWTAEAARNGCTDFAGTWTTNT